MISTTKVEGYTVATNTLGTETSDSIYYAPGLKPHRPNISMLGGHGGWLEREREEIKSQIFRQHQ